MTKRQLGWIEPWHVGPRGCPCDTVFDRLAELALCGSIRQREALRLVELLEFSSTENDTRELLAALGALVGRGEA